MMTKIVAVLGVAVLLGLIWLYGTNYLLRLKSGMLFEIGFWLGPWTFTGWIFFLIFVSLLSWLTIKFLAK